MQIRALAEQPLPTLFWVGGFISFLACGFWWVETEYEYPPGAIIYLYVAIVGWLIALVGLVTRVLHIDLSMPSGPPE